MNGSKRKQLAVPMVALMVCAVAFIGIGYAALNSTFETTNNSTDGQKLEVSMVKETGHDDAVFVGIEIPYGVHVKDNTTTYSIPDPVTLISSNITITDETTLYSGYTVTVELKDDSDNNITFGNLTPTITINNGSDISKASGQVTTVPLTITVPSGSVSDPSVLDKTDIHVKVTVVGIPKIVSQE